MVLEQSFIDGAELLNAEGAEVHGINGQGGLLRVWERIEEQTTEDIGQDSVAAAPLFEVGMASRIKQAAVVARDLVFGVFLFLGAVDEVAELLDVLVETSARSAVEFGKVLQRADQAGQRKLFKVFARLGFDRQQGTAIR